MGKIGARVGRGMDWLLGGGGTLPSYLAFRVVLATSAVATMAYVSITEGFYYGLGWLLWPLIYLLDVIFRKRAYEQGYVAGASTVSATMQEALRAGQTRMLIPDAPKMWEHREYMATVIERLDAIERERRGAPENYVATKGL